MFEAFVNRLFGSFSGNLGAFVGGKLAGLISASLGPAVASVFVSLEARSGSAGPFDTTSISTAFQWALIAAVLSAVVLAFGFRVHISRRHVGLLHLEIPVLRRRFFQLNLVGAALPVGCALTILVLFGGDSLSWLLADRFAAVPYLVAIIASFVVSFAFFCALMLPRSVRRSVPFAPFRPLIRGLGL